ncbi:hypothetical protein OIU85_000628 [Salix viminalis]|uniref:Uncharacterized protein n=1 Tax=Salix viminalis TaxID=40686 RepID=A0A9Q0VJV9_SALVM|nr:hypothetical protein OIU85_000628 [Salix viminalis]
MWRRIVKISSTTLTDCQRRSKDLYLKSWRLLKLTQTHCRLFREDHSGEAAAIDDRAKETFEQQYMDYEPTGATPSRSEPDLPSKGTIESLRAMPVEKSSR